VRRSWRISKSSNPFVAGWVWWKKKGGSRSEEQKEAVCTDKGDGVAVDQLVHGIAFAQSTAC